MITLSEDAATCPACESPLVALSRSQRRCNACELDCVVITAEDEREAEQRPPSRGEQGVSIARGQTRW